MSMNDEAGSQNMDINEQGDKEATSHDTTLHGMNLRTLDKLVMVQGDNTTAQAAADDDHDPDGGGAIIIPFPIPEYAVGSEAPILIGGEMQKAA